MLLIILFDIYFPFIPVYVCLCKDFDYSFGTNKTQQYAQIQRYAKEKSKTETDECNFTDAKIVALNMYDDHRSILFGIEASKNVLSLLLMLLTIQDPVLLKYPFNVTNL